MVNGQDPVPATPSLGAALHAARLDGGLTVEQISAVTRIRATLVRDLEADRFVSSGGDFYVRGHLRAIAAAIGTDPQPLVARFDREAATAPTPELLFEAPATSHDPAVRLSPLGGHAAGRVDRRGPHWALAGVAAVVILLGLGVIGTLDQRPAPSTVEANGTGAPSPSRSPVSSSPVPPAPDAVAEKPPPAGAELRVRIIGGTSWISVSSSAGPVFEGVLTDGQFKDFTDPAQLKVVIGNAGAVNLVCGGKDAGQAGSAGGVKRFACTSTGLVAG